MTDTKCSRQEGQKVKIWNKKFSKNIKFLVVLLRKNCYNNENFDAHGASERRVKMSKIVCDVCGSSYSESETHCPICGTAKSDAVKPVVETTADEQPVKAGKYSKNNTKRPAAGTSRNHSGTSRKSDTPSSTAMIAIVAVLLLAIVAVVVFIIARAADDPEPKDTVVSTTAQDPTTVVEIPCESITLTDAIDGPITFTELKKTFQLEVVATPADTTDPITYIAENPNVVYISNDGLVTSVSYGETKITVTCGAATPIELTVIVEEPAPVLELTSSEFTLSDKNGVTQDIYNLVKNKEKFDKEKFVLTSADESIVRADGTVVTALKSNGKGVKVTVQYGEQSVECLVRVGTIAQTAYKLSAGWGNEGTSITVTMVVDKADQKSIQLKLVDQNDNVVKIAESDWKFSKDFPRCCNSVYDASTGALTITATKTTEDLENGKYVYVKIVYQGVTYQCTIYVKPAAEN